MKNLLEKKTVKKVYNYLKNYNPNYDVIALDTSARTALDASKSLKVYVGAIVKSLVFKSSKENIYFLCLISGDKFLSIDRLIKVVGTQVNKASADEVKKYTGYSIGGIPPIAHDNPMITLIDKTLNRFDKIYAAAGHPYVIFGINFEEICNITKGKISDIVE